jgi:hypothetical protein
VLLYDILDSIDMVRGGQKFIFMYLNAATTSYVASRSLRLVEIQV